MIGPGPIVVLKYTPLGIAITLAGGGLLQAAGLADIDWGLLIGKVPEVAMVLVVVFYSLSMNEQNREFIEKMEARHAQAMDRIASEIKMLSQTIISHDSRMEQYIKDDYRR